LFICSCSTSGFLLPPNKDYCFGVLTFHVEHGSFGPTPLDDLSVAMLVHTPEGPMSTADWSVGLIVDQRADQAQRDALTGIFTGRAGGPMAALEPLITNFLGVEARPVLYQKNGLSRSVSIGEAVDYAVEGFASPTAAGEALCIDNPAHPANPRPALARSTRSHLHAFGLDWDDVSGRNNGHFAPFSWSA
jgi:hypothetical protein